MSMFILIAAKLRYRRLPNMTTRMLFCAFTISLFARDVSAGTIAYIALQPVPPRGEPPTTYPAGTVIVGREIILGSVPARVWLEMQIGDWEPAHIKTVQGTISATDWERDGGGYAGSSADCQGAPANGGDLRPALQPCNSDADCRVLSGVRCAIEEASKCINWDGTNPNYFPTGKFCQPGFQNRCQANWAAQDLACIAAVDSSTLDYRYGFTCDPGEYPTDFHPTYVGTLVLDVPADAKGTYTIDFQENQTFIQDDGPPGGEPPPTPMLSAKITVPCGRCCSGYRSGHATCTDHVVMGECPNTDDQVFTADEACPQDGGPECAECASNADCDDGVPCTVNRCGPDHVCFYEPDDALCDDGVFCNGPEVCSATTGCGPGEPPCVYYECDEEADACHPGIPTLSFWGVIAMTILLCIAAKLRYRRLPCAPLGLIIACAVLVFPQIADAGATTAMILQPVQPQTDPPSSYPPGTTIVGQTITLSSAPARVWIELQFTGWAPEVLKTIQMTISATDVEMDGGGYFGSAADCMGLPAFGGDLRPALQPCNADADCRAISGPRCVIQEASKCVTWNGVSPAYFPAGKFCEPGFQNLCNPRMGIVSDGVVLSCVKAVDYTTLNYRFGYTCNPGEDPPDFHPTYVGTLVLDVPANAKGTYTLDPQENQTFWQAGYAKRLDDIPLPAVHNAIITVPCGRCCSGYLNGQIECTDHVGIGECADAADQVFTADEVCPQAAGPDCAECASDADCDDGVSCTVNRCGPDHACFYEPDDALCDDGVFCNGAEVCSAVSNCGPSDPPCAYYECDEDADACHPGIPAVTPWGLVVLALAVLVVAKLQQKPVKVADN